MYNDLVSHQARTKVFPTFYNIISMTFTQITIHPKTNTLFVIDSIYIARIWTLQKDCYLQYVEIICWILNQSVLLTSMGSQMTDPS